MDYHKYINSPEWKVKREERLKIDGYKCVICKGSDNLEVHHLHYETLTNEDPLHDLVTVCGGQCHRYFDTIERYKRYEKRKQRVDLLRSAVQEREDISYGLANITISVDFELPNVNAQRANSGPAEQVVKIDQEDFRQACKNRRGS